MESYTMDESGLTPVNGLGDTWPTDHSARPVPSPLTTTATTVGGLSPVQQLQSSEPVTSSEPLPPVTASAPRGRDKSYEGVAKRVKKLAKVIPQTQYETRSVNFSHYITISDDVCNLLDKRDPMMPSSEREALMKEYNKLSERFDRKWAEFNSMDRGVGGRDGVDMSTAGVGSVRGLDASEETLPATYPDPVNPGEEYAQLSRELQEPLPNLYPVSSLVHSDQVEMRVQFLRTHQAHINAMKTRFGAISSQLSPENRQHLEGLLQQREAWFQREWAALGQQMNTVQEQVQTRFDSASDSTAPTPQQLADADELARLRSLNEDYAREPVSISEAAPTEAASTVQPTTAPVGDEEMQAIPVPGPGDLPAEIRGDTSRWFVRNIGMPAARPVARYLSTKRRNMGYTAQRVGVRLKYQASAFGELFIPKSVEAQVGGTRDELRTRELDAINQAQAEDAKRISSDRAIEDVNDLADVYQSALREHYALLPDEGIPEGGYSVLKDYHVRGAAQALRNLMNNGALESVLDEEGGYHLQQKHMKAVYTLLQVLKEGANARKMDGMDPLSLPRNQDNDNAVLIQGVLNDLYLRIESPNRYHRSLAQLGHGILNQLDVIKQGLDKEHEFYEEMKQGYDLFKRRLRETGHVQDLEAVTKKAAVFVGWCLADPVITQRQAEAIVNPLFDQLKIPAQRAEAQQRIQAFINPAPPVDNADT